MDSVFVNRTRTSPLRVLSMGSVHLGRAAATKTASRTEREAGFAITHNKIVKIDPFSDDCVAATASQGNNKLALTYATHVLDVYDHFAWRWSLHVTASSQPILF